MESRRAFSSLDEEVDYYEVLGANRRAGLEEIKRRYYERVKELHPDVNPDVDGARIVVLNEAFDVLSDPVQRYKYNSRNPYAGLYVGSLPTSTASTATSVTGVGIIQEPRIPARVQQTKSHFRVDYSRLRAQELENVHKAVLRPGMSHYVRPPSIRTIPRIKQILGLVVVPAVCVVWATSLYLSNQ